MGTLCVVATPIGNLEDVSQRALRILGEADRIFAEDTRRTQILLDRFDIDARASSLHEHNEASRIQGVLELLRSGANVALVSDAGTPLVSDPGARLVEAAIADGHEVDPIPGPSAVVAAVSVSGFRAVPFAFLGFLPRTRGARENLLKSYLARPETLVMFESPARLHDRLVELAEHLSGRRACVARELTKVHQEIARGSLEELAAHFGAGTKGECTIVVEGAGEAERAHTSPALLEGEFLDARIRECLAEGRRPREIAALLAPQTPLPRKVLYARVQALREEDRR
ncbi:MAG: 16S rRNA (cytidine(1402)-2'-O)-methyltransferase [bacterium]|nr:16S rRNA (cytidine(1402)-2'-O)-methyltransferase [bacterium]